MSSGYYSLLYNDVLVVNEKKKNFQVCNVFRQYQSLEPLPLLLAATVERYTTSLSVHNFPRKMKTCSCIHLKQRSHVRD